MCITHECLYFVTFALTLHGERLSRHRDVILALLGKAVMWQVVLVVLWEFHQRVICGGERLEKARIVEKTDREKQQDTSALSGVDERCEAPPGRETQASLVANKILCKRKTHIRERQSGGVRPLLF